MSQAPTLSPLDPGPLAGRSSLSDRFRAAWNGFWFEPSTPANLGFCRLIFFGGLFVFYALYPGTDYTKFAKPAFYHPTIAIFQFLGALYNLIAHGRFAGELPLPSAGTLNAIQIVWKVGLLLVAVGLGTSLALPAVFIAGTYLISLGHCFGKVGHGDMVIIWIMLVLGFARCADAWSFDALISRHLLKRPPARPGLSPEYTWPVRFVQLISATIFLASGVAKLRRSGLAWITSDNLQNTILLHYYGVASPWSRLGLAVAKAPILCKLLAASTVTIEIGMIFALFSRRARAVFVPCMALAQLGMGMMFGVFYPPFVMVYLWWVPFDRLGGALARRLGPRPAR